MNKLQNKYAFSFLGSVTTLAFASILTKIIIYSLGLSKVSTQDEGFGRLILITYIWPLFFIIGLTIYFFISKKIYKSFKESFLRIIDLFAWLILLGILLYAYIQLTL